MLAVAIAFAVALSAAAFAFAVWAAVKADDALHAAEQAHARARATDAQLLRAIIERPRRPQQ